jgi:hypothetical protein
VEFRTRAFAAPYGQLLALLARQRHLNCDETGHKDNGHRFWTWGLRATHSVLVQFCMAHLIRDVKFLCAFAEPSVQRYGKGLLAGPKALFWTLHRKDQLSARALESELAVAHDQIWRAALPGWGGPFHRLRQPVPSLLADAS